jgi:hypothetical protein
MALKVSFLSFVAVVVKSIRFTNAEGKEQRAKSKEQRARSREVRGQKAESRNDEARMVRAGMALNDEEMTQARNDELMLVLAIGQRTKS